MSFKDPNALQRRILLFEIVPHSLNGCDEGSLMSVDDTGGEQSEMMCFSV